MIQQQQHDEGALDEAINNFKHVVTTLDMTNQGKSLFILSISKFSLLQDQCFKIFNFKILSLTIKEERLPKQTQVC